ncbi:MAG TPA: GatB/YqeY domain-containing protein [Rhodopila sp.]|nr:GatB/YqeY domain-containing protein [Rhodopila sp.]
MGLRERINEETKASMKAGNAARTSTLRMILARLKDTDIAARPKGITQVPDEDIISMLRGMVKSRRESIELYRQGNRPELAAKEAAEIEVIESFLPAQMDPAAIEAAVNEAIQSANATGIKDMGNVMAMLKARHGAQLDMSVAGPIVKTRLQAL